MRKKKALKYKWLTKEILEKDCKELRKFYLIAKKYNIAISTLRRYLDLFEIDTVYVKPKVLTNNIVDFRLLEDNRPIKRLGDCVGAASKIDWECLIDGHIWKTTARDILHSKTGCPKCARNIKLTNKEVDSRLIGRSIKRCSNIINATTEANWECLICNYKWAICPRNILNMMHGCPRCAGQIKLTNEIVDERLTKINPNIRRIDSIIDSATPIRFGCLVDVCGCIWSTSPNNILNAETGCPDCNRTGKNEKLVHTILNDYDIFHERHKTIKSITGDKKRRMFVDFYIPEISTIIEYNGKQHYGPVIYWTKNVTESKSTFEKQYERDCYLQSVCDLNGINLIWIDGRKYHSRELKNYLINDLIPELKAKF